MTSILCFADEVMSKGQAVLLSVIGIALIALVLIVLMIVVKLMSLMVNKATVTTAKAEPTYNTSVAYQPTNPVQTARSLKLTNVTEQDAALIMTIVAYQTKIPLEELNFSSITLVEER